MNIIKIGKIKLKNPLFLAPMVDVTDLAFRLIARKSGAAICYTPMLHTDQIIHTNENTQKLMKTIKKDFPIGVQITGDNVKQIEKTVPFLENFDLIDINCGCPSKKIMGNSAGSYLLKDPKKIASFVKILKKRTNLPITVKIRLGFKKDESVLIAKTIEKAGADLLTVHTRLANESSKVRAKPNELKKIKDEVGIPLVGNGDVFTPNDAKKILDVCDGVMIARTAIGEPDIFNRSLYYLKTGKIKPISSNKNIMFFKDYLKFAKKYDTFDIGRTKYIGSRIIKGIPEAAKLRNELMQLSNWKEIEEFVKIKLI